MKAAKRKGLFSSIADGTIRLLYFASCAISFWFGVRWVLEDRDKDNKKYSPAVLIIVSIDMNPNHKNSLSTNLLIYNFQVFFSLITAAENLARLTPFLETLSSARGSAKGIFSVIDRQSKIDSLSKNGIELNCDVNGKIEFRNVSFSYPSRPDVQVISIYFHVFTHNF